MFYGVYDAFKIVDAKFEELEDKTAKNMSRTKSLDEELLRFRDESRQNWNVMLAHKYNAESLTAKVADLDSQVRTMCGRLNDRVHLLDEKVDVLLAWRHEMRMLSFLGRIRWLFTGRID